jgi:hypothetical protein
VAPARSRCPPRAADAVGLDYEPVDLCLAIGAALDERTEDAAEATAIAKASAARAAREVVEAALQVLGGIGFTWEHDLHLLQRRVLECERRFDDALHHERVVAAHRSCVVERERQREAALQRYQPVAGLEASGDPRGVRRARATRLGERVLSRSCGVT